MKDKSTILRVSETGIMCRSAAVVCSTKRVSGIRMKAEQSLTKLGINEHTVGTVDVHLREDAKILNAFDLGKAKVL